MKRLVLLLPTATYRAADFVSAAARLGAEVVVASERRQALAPSMGDRALVVNLSKPEVAADAIVALDSGPGVDGIVAVDDQGVMAAALAAQRLGLAHNPPEAVARSRDKVAMRTALSAAGVPQPAWAVVAASDDPGQVASSVGFPCVVKPTNLSGSRGVIRADDLDSARTAGLRARAIAATAAVEGSRRSGRRASRSGLPTLPPAAPPAGPPASPPASPPAGAPAHSESDSSGPAARLIVESFVSGAEVAVEGLLRGGRLEVLAVFDKPDPLDGPYFEETIYVTPSRLPEPSLSSVRALTGRACAAMGLVEGPIHAELRTSGERAWVIEVAARSIGGLCSRSLSFGTGMSLETLIVAHALGLPLGDIRRERAASGVMMLPIPAAGVLVGVSGREAALAVPGVTGLEVSIPPGRQVVPLPEGDRYLGFVFAKAPTPAEVCSALRRAQAALEVRIERRAPPAG